MLYVYVVDGLTLSMLGFLPLAYSTQLAATSSMFFLVSLKYNINCVYMTSNKIYTDLFNLI